MIRLSNLSVQSGAFRLTGVDIAIPTGQYGVLMGRTGSGKTTILEAVCGLRKVTGGRIELLGRNVTSLTPAERGIGYVPQDRALFRTMTVHQHLAFALKIRGWKPAAIEERVIELAELLSVQRLLHRRPIGLSGGESQRVALGRALAFRPGILCLDEPLSALDDDTRLEMYELLEKVREHTGVTVLHVTHHWGEAERLGDQIMRINSTGVETIETRTESQFEAPR